MLIDWIYWLSTLHPSELLLILSPILLLDAPRYALGSVAVWVCDCAGHAVGWMMGRTEASSFDYVPDVCVIIAGLNEADSLAQTMDSVIGSYPRMQVIIVDDGSTDGMTEVANSIARRREDVTVITKPSRGGKSSALNAALPYTEAEILVCVDSDSYLGEHAIWEIVQPFADSRVGAVSGAVYVRNPFAGLVSWLQSLEYMRCIFLGRMLTSRLGVLGVVSGAFGAYRRTAVSRVGGWDVGPGEDGDITLRLRRSGYEVVFSAYASCFTNAVARWRPLTAQRRRWEWAVITFEMRKHVDMANPLHANFRFRNLLMLLDRWAYSVVFQYCFLCYVIWQLFHLHDETLYQYLLFYVVYVFFELLQLLLLLYYSPQRGRVLAVSLVMPLMPIYYLYMRLITLWAVTEEIIHRRSYKDGFVPAHVRSVTWHW
jgi:cellulose synthase/poly-beta-1,6-N-acetylglucosamine synthase-like glycosyltransferase